MIDIKYLLMTLVVASSFGCSDGSSNGDGGTTDTDTDTDTDTVTDTDTDTGTDTGTDFDAGPDGSTATDCTSGICCDTSTSLYRLSTYPCDVTIAYSCTSADCGADTQEQDTTQYCSGTSELCNGSIVPGGWITVDDCATDAICEYDTTDSWCTTCLYGCSLGYCNPHCIPAWIENTVDGAFDGAWSVYAADVDGDGDMDVLGTAASDIAWWENTAGDGTTWTEHTVDGTFNGAYSVYAADVDGDGDMDVLGAAWSADDITWWENTAGDGTAWTEHTVDGAFDGAVSVYAADVDGDGDMDVLGAAESDHAIAWWENTAGDGTVWTEHTIDGAFNGASSEYVADVDGDGDMDVLGAAAFGDAILKDPLKIRHDPARS